jgi:S1-C subfamily serine protease
MAETLVRTLTSGAPEEQIVVLIGKGHISDRVGVPKLTDERVKDPYRTIAPIPLDYPGRTADPGIADFVWITNRSEPVHRVRLGVLFRVLSSRGGLKVQEILPDSPAAKAGLKEGDILKMVDGAPVFNLMDVHKALSSKGTHELILHRDNHDLSVTVTLPP